ncbi:guanine nucleotide-binding protein alpha-4 subunit [Coprinopsis cinerea AmutBmut pab1-1]|nr:guanine nucleotide-binding protein alpha-4 subunit [Coprinopsis cinerea AmutBmut pab1-1]
MMQPSHEAGAPFGVPFLDRTPSVLLPPRFGSARRVVPLQGCFLTTMAPSLDLSDPLSRAVAPPPNETTEEREARMLEEKRAKSISDAIDEEIEAQRVAVKKGPKPIKILLLGQSESGKSTTLKNFQLMFEPKAFQLEKASWRAVIQLNLVRSFHVIIDALTRAQQLGADFQEGQETITIPTDLLKTKLRLTPLLAIEDILIRRLTPVGSGEIEATQLSSGKTYTERTKHYIKEVAVNSANQWKDTFNRLVRVEAQRHSFESVDGIDWDDPNDPGRVLHECAEDMIKLWADPITQKVLQIQGIRMQDAAGFFLDQIERITAPRYIPTVDDILRARLKTLGVSEHRFTLSSTGALSRDWRVFDVGGHRSQVTAWVPFFDDMDTIIFLAPISGFDQNLAEDPRMNRLADSVSLWSELTRNQLLKETNLILFLNKVDIFKAKLEAGIKFGDHVVSYGDRPNTFEHTTAYIRRKFANILKENSPLPRVFYSHLTTVTDTKSTKLILSNLQEMIMREALVQTNLLA